MKKLIIFAGALLLLAAGTAGFFASRPMTAQEALILRNVEAIAQGETLDLNNHCGNDCSICFCSIPIEHNGRTGTMTVPGFFTKQE
ncbi:MAG TPA: hypothetical protein DEQ30_05625 [Porphyromonadaceae bacterium]|nr:hypothetical protein [Porphyromonadaceae bacterium]